MGDFPGPGHVLMLLTGISIGINYNNTPGRKGPDCVMYQQEVCLQQRGVLYISNWLLQWPGLNSEPLARRSKLNKGIL